jgi:hypothetical protein
LILHWGAFIILLLTFATVLYQDFKWRAIFAYLPLVIYISSLVWGYTLLSFHEIIVFSLTNLCISAFQFCLLYVYIRLTKAPQASFFDSYIGVGDVLFIAAITPLFSPLNFVVFNLTAFLIISILYLITNKLISIKNKHIPLAGLLSLFLIITLITCIYLKQTYTPYNDNMIMELIL